MTHGTKKVGIAGKYGSRYGVKIRKRLMETESERVKKRMCPRCAHVAVKRHDTGIWLCRHCGYKYAAGAYVPKIREFKREDLLVAEDEIEAVVEKKPKAAPKVAEAPKVPVKRVAEPEELPVEEEVVAPKKKKGAKK